MKKADLKKVIKPLIRECLTEIFAEIHLEQLIENVIREQKFPKEPRTLREEVSPEANYETSTEDQKKVMMERLGISESEWRDMYADIAESDNPIVTGEQDDKPEYVSESVLRQTGLYKDYSKFIP